MYQNNSLAPIAFIDSGVGGLPYLAHMRTLLRRAPMVYVADNLTFPYGNKTEDQIRVGVQSMVQRLTERYQPEIIVVACNTASVVALGQLREEFNYDFVGVVPAIKPAAEISKTGVIGLLATERTIKGAYLEKLIQDHASGKKVVKQAATELIRSIEDDPFAQDRRRAETLLQQTYETFRSQGADTIVLGCTHFLHLDDAFHRVFGTGFTVLDSREGVSRQTLRVMERKGHLENYREIRNSSKSPSILHLTREAPGGSTYERIAPVFGLEYGGNL